MNKLKIIDNPDTEMKETAEAALKEMKRKYGKRYCPCSFLRIDSFVCPCQDFRESECEGECNCGRYKKIISE